MNIRQSLGGGAERKYPLKGKDLKVNRGFTLAEVLITLGIIGVVAAVILPTVINKIKDQQYLAARKKVLYTLSEGLRAIANQGDTSKSTSAKEFVENQLKKQIKIIKTCENNNLRACGIETTENKIYNLEGNPITMPKKIGELSLSLGYSGDVDPYSTSYGFVMSNGYSAHLFYNPKCKTDIKYADHYGRDKVCVNVIYDMNGLAQPNQVGKDIGFVTMLYPDITTRIVAPDPYKKNAAGSDFNSADASCKALDKDLSIPDRDELLSMYYNATLLGISSGDYWSSSEASEELGWLQCFNDGNRYRNAKSGSNGVRCVRR